jgi:GDSL-like lipase/acylhydrolase family protein
MSAQSAGESGGPAPQRAHARPVRRLTPRLRLAARLGLMFGGTLVGLLLAELLLTVMDRPRFYKAHSFPSQFGFSPFATQGAPLYVNAPSSRIRFVYDGNPRGYFGPANEVEHTTNQLGFRGPEFAVSNQDGRLVATKPADTVRVVFLGDSFTFGEGVRDEDTYPARTAALLGQEHPSGSPRFEAYNLGVGAYNTTQELSLLEHLGLKLLPDCVVLGYVLNDAEPPMFEVNPQTNSFERTGHEGPEGFGDPLPPDQLLYRLRTARLVWQLAANSDRSRRIVAHYRALYEDGSPGWQESRRALRQIIARCHEARVPCYVLLFPILYEMGEAYPFRAIHEKIRAEVEGLDATLIDLFPRLKGQPDESLWVHPADQHPNEQVQRIAAEELAAALRARGPWK